MLALRYRLSLSAHSAGPKRTCSAARAARLVQRAQNQRVPRENCLFFFARAELYTASGLRLDWSEHMLNANAEDISTVVAVASMLRNLSSVARSTRYAYPRLIEGPKLGLGTTRKCAWRGGPSRCAELFLAAGRPMSAEAATAIRWVLGRQKEGLLSGALQGNVSHWPTTCARPLEPCATAVSFGRLTGAARCRPTAVDRR